MRGAPRPADPWHVIALQRLAVAGALLVGLAAAAPGATAMPARIAQDLSTSTRYSSGVVPGAGLCNDPALTRKRPVSLPADDAAHPRDPWNYWEWWYWTGHLTTSDKKAPRRRFAFATVFEFKRHLHIQKADTTIIDLNAQKLHESHDGLIAGDPAPVRDGFALRAAQATAVGGGGHDHIRQQVGGYAIDISLSSRKPAAPTFGEGYGSVYCQNAFDYQRQRMRITGTAVHDGVAMSVRGWGRFEHSWGFDPAYQGAQSDYLQLLLGDGTDIFLGIVRFPRFNDSRAPVHLPTPVEAQLGTISDRNGNVTALGRGDFELTPTRSFQPSAGCSYPIAFDVAVEGRHYSVAPSLRDAELRSTSVPLNNVLWAEDPTIWDGPGTVSGDATGLAWLDFVGYCAGR
jgi:predicted secreted hydrolase